MPLSGMLSCGNCGTRTQMNSMRYNLNGNKLICQNCVEKERSAIKPGTTQAIRLRKEQAEPREAHEKPASEGMVGYYCRSCHFRFARKREMDVASCPYCARQTITTAFEGKAQDLLESSSSENEAF